jgi:hypothetical protein
MRRLLSILASLVYIANCAAASTAAIIFVNWYDTGRVDTRGWAFMVMAGLFSGSGSWALEQLLYRRFGIWPRNRLLFFFRIVAADIFLLRWVLLLGMPSSRLSQAESAPLY